MNLTALQNFETLQNVVILKYSFLATGHVGVMKTA